jgi:hypothetical protein
MKALIQNIFAHPSFKDDPPVLLDIGASGQLPSEWRDLAAHSIGIAFDADTRDFEIQETQDQRTWKQLYKLNRLIVPTIASDTEKVDFYLTRSPYCSSTLAPDLKALEPWLFQNLFEVVQKTQLPGITLPQILETLGIQRIDWYKSDSQGTDLSIFASLPETMIHTIIAADFEPGIIDAYVGEDKLYHLMQYMDSQPFWVADMQVKGTQRVYPNRLDLAEFPLIDRFHRSSPGWCGISYINTFTDLQPNLRSLLLGWVFSTIKKQYGFSLFVATIGQATFADPIFDQLVHYSQKKLKINLPRRLLRRFSDRILYLSKRLLNN